MRTLLSFAVLGIAAMPAGAQVVLRSAQGDSVRVFISRATVADVRALHSELETLRAEIRRIEVQLRAVSDSVDVGSNRQVVLERFITGQDGLLRLYSELYPKQSRLTLACSGLRATSGGREGYLGVSFATSMQVDAAAGRAGQTTWSEGPVRVDLVEPGSPAEKAGVRVGEELLLLGGRPVAALADSFLDELLTPGARVVLRLRAYGREREVEVPVARRPEFPARECAGAGGFAIAAPFASFFGELRVRGVAPAAPVRVTPEVRATLLPSVVLSAGARVAVYGATFRILDADARDVVKVDGDGVLVDHVSPGTPAHAAGLRSFDVVTRINGRTIRSPLDMRRASDDERTLVLTVVRGGDSRTVTLRR
jgi:hypothetical protein